MENTCHSEVLPADTCTACALVSRDASGGDAGVERHSITALSCVDVRVRRSSLKDPPAEGLWVFSKPEGVKAKISWKLSWSSQAIDIREMTGSAVLRGFMTSSHETLQQGRAEQSSTLQVRGKLRAWKPRCSLCSYDNIHRAACRHLQ